MSQTFMPSLEKRAAGFTAIRATVAEIGEQRLAWEREAAQLFDDFDSLVIRLAVESAAEQRPETSSSDNRDSTGDCWTQLAGQQQAIARQQQDATAELNAMRQMMEQQTELLAAFVSAATAHGRESGLHAGSSVKSDPIVSAVQTQFAQLNRPPVTEIRAGAIRPGLVRAG